MRGRQASRGLRFCHDLRHVSQLQLAVETTAFAILQTNLTRAATLSMSVQANILEGFQERAARL
ncbi:MAG: hypothetical protein H0T05_03010 [Acidobacteria bacterium]|nr:hypothetical protein [Acidobacteriota bacterium]